MAGKRGKNQRIRNHKAVINKIVDNMTLMDDDLICIIRSWQKA